jgi:hypothetical protein
MKNTPSSATQRVLNSKPNQMLLFTIFFLIGGNQGDTKKGQT